LEKAVLFGVVFYNNNNNKKNLSCIDNYSDGSHLAFAGLQQATRGAGLLLLCVARNESKRKSGGKKGALKMAVMLPGRASYVAVS